MCQLANVPAEYFCNTRVFKASVVPTSLKFSCCSCFWKSANFFLFCVIAEDFGWSQREGESFPRQNLWKFREVLSYDLGWMQRRGRRKGKEARMGATHSAQRWPVSSKWFLFLRPVFLTINPWSVGTKTSKDDPKSQKDGCNAVNSLTGFLKMNPFSLVKTSLNAPEKPNSTQHWPVFLKLILYPWSIEWKTLPKMIPKRHTIMQRKFFDWLSFSSINPFLHWRKKIWKICEMKLIPIFSGLGLGWAEWLKLPTCRTYKNYSGQLRGTLFS